MSQQEQVGPVAESVKKPMRMDAASPDMLTTQRNALADGLVDLVGKIAPELVHEGRISLDELEKFLLTSLHPLAALFMG